MRGDLQATGARSLATIPRGRWRVRTWITQVTRRPRRVNEERLELIERLASQERRARQSGEYVADVGRGLRRW
jgi:hypothetical protein